MTHQKFIRFVAFGFLMLFQRTGISQQNISNALNIRGDPTALRFLRDMELPPKLSAQVATDVATLPASEAKASIANRLRLELLGDGVFDQRFAQKKGESADEVSLPAGADGSIQLRDIARNKDASKDHMELQAILPDSQVLATAYAVYNKSLKLVQQTNPGIAVDPPSRGTPIPPAPASDAIKFGSAVRVGVAPTQTLPGTPAQKLDNCRVPFDKLDTAGCAKNGQRCETFSRWEFGEVVELTTPIGGTCTGTLVASQWILSAAHCFIPDQSSQDFSSVASDRRDAQGNAVLALKDLGHTAVYARYADPKADPYSSGARKRVSRVIVNSHWDPKRVIEDGKMVVVSTQTVRADWVYPSDLALIRLEDSDAVAQITPAALPSKTYLGEITTAGYGVTTVDNGGAGQLWVTWPNSPLSAAHGELQLDQLGGPNISTFCEGDSGGPAFEGRNRGCPAADGETRPRILIGVSSHYYGQIPSAGNSAKDEAGFCMNAPVMRFMNMASSEYHDWVCTTTNKHVQGCG